jgi:SAM-dependent methyltransferase
MASDATAPTQRFSDRVADYVRYRPGYPTAVLDILQTETELTAPARIADVGSGTGISAQLFLSAGHTVYGVEPNAAMRAAAEQQLAGFPAFHSVAGTSDATTLADGSVDFVVVAQAFHWFEPTATRREFLRILRPQGWCVLLWNTRRLDATPFLRGYEALLTTYGTDYQQVRHENVDAAAIARFFDGPFVRRSIPHAQHFDYAGLRGRLLSSSYAPAAGHPQHEPMLQELRRLFDEHAVEGTVSMEYDTEVYFGRLG